jgi:tRNA (guanine37-N1)-methyltransferase
MNLKERLRPYLTESELNILPRGFEILGNIAIIQIPEKLEGKKGLIAKAVQEQHKQIKTVLRKIGKVDEEYRLPKYEILLGTETETIHVENHCRFKLDPTKVYFSEKLGSERWRIVQQVKEGEIINAWFCGIGPYPIEIAKNVKTRIYAIEKNPECYKYLLENIKLNKVKNIECFLGDVREIAPKLKTKADRTIMPLPKFSFEFLELALKHTKKGGIINFYTFSAEKELNNTVERLKNECKIFGKKIKIINIVKCGHYSPRVYRYCIDFKIIS